MSVEVGLQLEFKRACEQDRKILPDWAQQVFFVDGIHGSQNRCKLVCLGQELVGVVAWFMPRIHRSEYFLSLR